MNEILILYYSAKAAPPRLARQLPRVEGSPACGSSADGSAGRGHYRSPRSRGTGRGARRTPLSRLVECCGLILGSPTRSATCGAAEVFFGRKPSALWLSGALVDKPAAVSPQRRRCTADKSHAPMQ